VCAEAARSLLAGSDGSVKGVFDVGEFVYEAVGGRASADTDDTFAVEFGANIRNGCLSRLSLEFVLRMIDKAPRSWGVNSICGVSKWTVWFAH
jgi:hypothetical protein